MDDAQIINLFQTLNRERISRLSSLLPARNRNFIEFLPLLFHVNSTSLPGYINTETPAGIVDYQPTQHALDAAKKYNRTFNYRRGALHKYPIRALYFINKNGIYNQNSDIFEFWLIHSSKMSAAQRTLLSQKVTAITSWADSEKISIQINVFDEETLTKETISDFDLELLYSCGLLLAGCSPSWWSENLNGEDQELSARFAKDTIHFDAVSTPLAQALFDLAVTQVNKAMEQGLESCLDLVFLNYRLENFPNIIWLHHVLKQVLLDDETDPMLLDINTLKLRILDQNLSNKNALELAKKSLYIQSKEVLSKKIKQVAYPWRRTFIEEQVASWHWQKSVIENLDQQIQLNFRQGLSLFELVRDQLNSSIETLSNFSKRHTLSSSKILRQLQQKFDAIFTDQTDIINQLPISFFPKKIEEYLYLYRTAKSNHWHIDDQPTTTSKTSLYQHSSLLNVISWAVSNHLLSSSTRLKVADETHAIKTNVILELVQYLLRSPLSNKPETYKQDQLDKTAQINRILLFANLDYQASDSLSQHGLEISSLQADPLNYANKKQNLIAKVEGLIQSDQNQWHYFSFKGSDCLLQMISATVFWQPKELAPTSISCWCRYGNHGQNISDRIETIYRNVIAHYQENPDNADYLISIAERLHQIHWQEHFCDITKLPKKTSLAQYLANNRAQFYKTKLDTMLDKEGLLSIILKQQQESQISLFLLTERSHITLYIVDELGCLIKQQFDDLKTSTIINHFHTFLTILTNRNPAIKHAFFQLTEDRKSGFSISTLSPKKVAEKQGFLPVVIEMASTNEDAQCSIRCGSKTFTGLADESTLFSQVRELVLSLRKANNYYPLYITQLTFEEAHVTTRDHLIHKQRLEHLLNH